MGIAVLFGGTREEGNTEHLAEICIQDLAVERIYLSEYNIHPIVDQRHIEGGFEEVDDDYDQVLRKFLPHEIIIFATPIYWYTMSSHMKLFIDRWSQTLKDPNYPEFRNLMASKKAFVLAVGGDTPKIKGLPLLQQFNHIFDFFKMTYEGYILAEANKPGEILKDKEALFAASQLHKTLLRM